MLEHETSGKTNEIYETTDTALAGYLYNKGFKIIDIEYHDDSDGRASILFQVDSEINNHVRFYFTGNAQIEPRAYTRIMRRLSKILRNHESWHQEVFNS